MPHVLALAAQEFGFDWWQQMVVVNGAIGRLLTATLLGALVGIERELSHKAAGLRTNILISLGAAFFTMLSPVLAGDIGTNRGQVASNIVQGIGFLGAGLILHNRNRVNGLTSAASVWVMASIGMACGAGLYAPAAVATVIVIVALELVGLVERKANLKNFSLLYEARGPEPAAMMQAILEAMDAAHQPLADLISEPVGTVERVRFSLTATRRAHERLKADLRSKEPIEKLLTFRDPEED